MIPFRGRRTKNLKSNVFIYNEAGRKYLALTFLRLLITNLSTPTDQNIKKITHEDPTPNGR